MHIVSEVQGILKNNSDVLDLLKLADIVYSGTNQNHCMITQGDITADGILDIVDIFAFATMLSEGGFDN